MGGPIGGGGGGGCRIVCLPVAGEENWGGLWAALGWTPLAKPEGEAGMAGAP